MNVKTLTAIIEGTAPVIRKFVAESTAPLAQRLQALEFEAVQRDQRLDALLREMAELKQAAAKRADQ